MKMIKVSILCSLFLASTELIAQITIDSCQNMARKNYPLVKQYNLIEQSKEFNISNVAKGNLPQIVFAGQATYQSDITSIPGMTFKLPQDQYSLSVNINQNVWDGGSINAEKRLSEAN